MGLRKILRRLWFALSRRAPCGAWSGKRKPQTAKRLCKTTHINCRFWDDTAESHHGEPFFRSFLATQKGSFFNHNPNIPQFIEITQVRIKTSTILSITPEKRKHQNK
jgi:hypothetical protein